MHILSSGEEIQGDRKKSKGKGKGGGKDGKIGRRIEERRGRQGKRKDKRESEVRWGRCRCCTVILYSPLPQCTQKDLTYPFSKLKCACGLT